MPASEAIGILHDISLFYERLDALLHGDTANACLLGKLGDGDIGIVVHSLKDGAHGRAVKGDAFAVEPPGGLLTDSKLNKASFIMVLRFYITNSYYGALQ